MSDSFNKTHCCNVIYLYIFNLNNVVIMIGISFAANFWINVIIIEMMLG